MAEMTDAERCNVYLSLLRGLAQESQDRLCAEDKQHAWGPMTATDHWPDIPFTPSNAAMVADVKVYRSYRRECLNCGREQIS